VSDAIPPGNPADSEARHEADHANIAEKLGLLHQQGFICNVKNPDFAGGAKGDGATDDTAAINAAIRAAHGFPNGGIVEFPYGTYATSAPLVSASNDIWFVGPHGPKATMGGAGNSNDSSATIKPLSTWAKGSANQPAAILVDAVAAGRRLSRGGIVNISVDGGNLPPSTLMHGIATYGHIGAWTLHDFIVASIANTSSVGVNQVADPAGAEPQGNSITRGLVQSTMGGGVILSAGDATIEHIHTQGTGGNGISIIGRGGDTRLSQCRGDLARLNGFYINVPCGQYLGMVQLSNCSSQRNGNNGIKIANSAADRISVVYCTGCVFQGDGTAGSPNSGIRLSGPVGAVFTGCGVHVNSGIPADGSGTWPAYAITTAADSVAPPVFVDIHGGFYNAATAFSNKISAPLISVVDALEYHGGQWRPNLAPAHITAL
jgi:Pectate lyase superfamily protein